MKKKKKKSFLHEKTIFGSCIYFNMNTSSEYLVFSYFHRFISIFLIPIYIYIYIYIYILFYCIVFAMKNNHSGLINFEVKTSSSETFFLNQLSVICPIFLKI